ncbi:dirigent protein 2-like [Prunus dulcis]|uniref:dirigent protein 2-like n=1 Tax=Prunus dulcis TaxID=3755 RepID=UPI0014828993|nr:dirigent protein 2-like [Prunus dulcis]
MASNFIPNLSDFSFSLLLVLAMAPFLAQSSELKETQLVLYFQDNVSAGPNATSLPVAGIAGKLWTFTQIGIVYVTDDPLTAGPEPNSASIGRGQGIAVVAALNGRNALVLLSLVFTNQEYNGSTLELQGNSKQFEQVTEVAVVSGIGRFRFARGYATFETNLLDPATSYSVERCNVTVQHY